MENRDFFAAEKLALGIQTLADRYSYCGIPVKEVETLLAKLCPATVYLAMRDSLAEIQNPRDYILKHQEMDRFYANSGIGDLGITHEPIQEKILEGRYPHWLLELFRYFMDEHNPEAAFILLNAMKNAGMKPIDLMNEQIELGVKLARLHIAEDDSRSPYVLLNEYTRNDKWYRSLRKYYLEEWETYRETE
jgi:hypothetical protein